jgi:hypothetical protein
MSNVNRDKNLFDAMIALKRHLRSCRECRTARKAMDPYLMCRLGMNLTLSAADRYDLLISLRARAFRDKQGTVIACPDASKHGTSYSLTAMPLHVTGIQEGLF